MNLKKAQIAQDVFGASGPKVQVTKKFMGDLASSSAGGAFGAFLYDVITKKEEKLSSMLTELATASSSGVIFGLLMNNVPFFGVSIASLLSIYGVKSLASNKLIGNSQKIKMVTEVLAKNGATIGLSIAGGFIGQILIPVPFVGSFVGAAVAGFTGSALVGTYDILTTKSISIQGFCLYCLLTTFQLGFWVHYDKSYKFDSHFDLEIIEKMSKLIVFIDPKCLEQLQIEIETKRPKMKKLLHEIFCATAPEKIKSKKVENEYEQEILWKTVICFGVISHFYYYLSLTLNLMIQYDDFPEEIFLEKISKFFKLLEPAKTIDFIVEREVGLIEGVRSPYNVVLVHLEELMKKRKIFNSFDERVKGLRKKVKKIEEVRRKNSGAGKKSKKFFGLI